VIVKIGSRVLVRSNGAPDLRRIRALVTDIASLHKSGKEVIVVSSGAIAAGVQALGLRQRPDDLSELQMAAAVGQVRLMTLYDRFFAEEGCSIAQVLLTHDDLQHRARHLNSRNTLFALLRNRIIPIINENDVVAVDEIKFGDNDILASLVTILVEGDLLMLLSTTNGFREPAGGGKTRRVSHLEGIREETLALATGKGSSFSVGGMASKLRSAEMATNIGARVVIADGRRPGVIQKIVMGKDNGTLIWNPVFRGDESLSHRKRWLAFFHKAKGTVVVDAGAESAIEANQHSLLPIGVNQVNGEFSKGSLINVKGPDGRIIARGLSEYSSSEIEMIKGRKTSEIQKILGSRDCDEIIHRDNMVVLKGTTNGLSP
jgi:glutamate 5-kinase